MESTRIADYTPLLDLYETQQAIGRLKTTFETNLAQRLHLDRVSAPLFLDCAAAINDGLDGHSHPVTFEVPSVHATAEVVQSLSKWKRVALHRYGFPVGAGLYTDMNAIRRDVKADETHSVYVDQWDWERVIRPEERTKDTLHQCAEQVVHAICDTEITLRNSFEALTAHRELCRSVTYITAQELERLYPDLTPAQREREFVRIHRTVFFEGLGLPLSNGEPHRRRAPDSDDWALNGELHFWDEVLDRNLPVMTMGIRVDREAMDRQLILCGRDDLRDKAFHQAVLNGVFPATVGGGIGQSRLSMLILGKAHIGEVQVGLWDDAARQDCTARHVPLL